MSLAPFVCWERDGIALGGMDGGVEGEAKWGRGGGGGGGQKQGWSKKEREGTDWRKEEESKHEEHCQGVCMFQKDK